MIEILSSTPLATIQDLGRDGYRRFGVGTAGAMDQVALTIGNILLGNPEDAAGIEIPIFPFKVRFLRDIAIALTGADCMAEIDGHAIPPWWTRPVAAGQVLTLRTPARGARCYLTLAGGVDVPVVLGSRSTQLRGEFGGHHGRFLQKGDVLSAVGITTGSVTPDQLEQPGFGIEPPDFALPVGDWLAACDRRVTPVRVLRAAEYDCFSDAALSDFWNSDWKITPQSNRYGYRLDGPVLAPLQPIEKRSRGIVPGVIQVPPSGLPIIQLRDAQTSGGYPTIGTVIEADLWRLGQARLGGRLRFVETTYELALNASDQISAYLQKLRPLTKLYRSRVRAA